MRATYLTAILIAVGIGLWLFSGQLGKESPPPHPTLAELNRTNAASRADDAPVRIRARVVHASEQQRAVRVRGRTENKRTVEVRAETTGRITARSIERGDAVERGDVLCRVSLEDREARLTEARESLNQARIEYRGSLKLRDRGFQSETAIAQAKARMAAAEANLAARRLDIERTFIRAPFDGLVEDVQLEVGDFVTPGSACATIVDLDPMLLVGRVSEKDVLATRVGEHAEGVTANGQRVSGKISFVGQQSDPATRTYALEIEVPNPDFSLRSGITTEILVPVETVAAHKISPALFALDDEGSIGVRTVDANDRVEFHRVEVVRDDVDGVWVTGLPTISTVITVGQELVVAGQEVDVTYEPSGEMPAAAPEGTSRKPSGAARQGANSPTLAKPMAQAGLTKS